ncbi:MAG: glycerol-3-phosphate dehydrogenase [Acidobacteria bacterium]|nr:glycerol-3-phosphate dehydrogenase [Acidobacteriota bacterium]
MRSSPIPANIENASFDAIIIGAGINGAGIARDAAMRGLKVLLLDKGDIAGGTSSYSTRLIHGGLRYLEHGEVGLVRESLRERERLLHIAPHLVRALPLLIPIYTTNRRGRWTIRAGMILYDALSFDKSLDRHQILSREETLRRVPGLNPEGLRGATVYYDAQVEYAERLVLENALSARDRGAFIPTYARVDRLILEGKTVRGVEFTDLLGGAVRRAHAPVTVNGAGPWVDEVLTGLGRPMDRLIGGTKGSHIVMNAFPGAPKDALYVEALEDRRPFFIIPWNNQYLIGTTDARYEGDLDHIEADEEEIAYLIRETNRVIPQAHLTRDRVLYTYSGVRPLPFIEERPERSITRRYTIHDHAPDLEGLISIVGGKLTSYRNLSERTVDLLFKKLGRKPPPCVTAQVPLPGAATKDFAAFSEWFVAHHSLPEASAQRLLRIYGTRAVEVLRIAEEASDLREPISLTTGAIGAEILMAFRHEMAETLADALLRRTVVGLGPTVGLDADEAAARIAQEYLGWDQDRVKREIAAYREYIARFHPQTK